MTLSFSLPPAPVCRLHSKMLWICSCDIETELQHSGAQGNVKRVFRTNTLKNKQCFSLAVIFFLFYLHFIITGN